MSNFEEAMANAFNMLSGVNEGVAVSSMTQEMLDELSNWYN